MSTESQEGEREARTCRGKPTAQRFSSTLAVSRGQRATSRHQPMTRVDRRLQRVVGQRPHQHFNADWTLRLTPPADLAATSAPLTTARMAPGGPKPEMPPRQWHCPSAAPRPTHDPSPTSAATTVRSKNLSFPSGQRCGSPAGAHDDPGAGRVQPLVGPRVFATVESCPEPNRLARWSCQ